MAFKVLIVGGSVSGLTLALILETYGIDYLILEKHDEIAPLLGTTIGINPNGARILDQLGVYSALDKIGAKLNTILYHDWQGKLLSAQEPIDESMKWLSDLLRVLYAAVKDKSRIRTGVEIVDILEYQSQVRVRCRDGVEYWGDILVGADGVRSHIRNELWRIAESHIPGYIPANNKDSIVSTYSCMTGISPCPAGLADKQVSRSINYHRSCVVVAQPGGELCWWLAFFKNEKQFSHPRIPRYTIDDHQKILKKYGSDKIGETTFDQIYETAHHKVLVPVEEFTLEKWFFGRIVLLGDACHKVHPIIGQGANQAIESAACLADLLHDISLGKIINTDDAIRTAFSQYHSTRYRRAVSVTNAGRFAQCIDSLDTWWFKYLALHKVTKAPIDKGFLPSFANMMLPAVSLKGVPQPRHSGNMLYEDQVRIQPSERSKYTTRVLLFFLLLLASAVCYIETVSDLSQTYELQFYFAIQAISINSLWVIESYRFGSSTFMSALSFVAVATYSNRWDVSLIIYLAYYIYQSGGRDFYYPNPRSIDIGVAMALPYSALLAYTLPIYETTITQKHSHLSWAVAHLAFPILVYIMNTVLHKTGNLPTGFKTAFTGDVDITLLRRHHNLLILVLSCTHLWIFTRCYNNAEALLSWIGSLIGLSVTISAFTVFVVWDLNRVNIFDGSITASLAFSLLGILTFGPGAVLAALWRWREVKVEKARKERVLF